MTSSLSQQLSEPLFLLPNSQILCGYNRIYRDFECFRGLVNVLAQNI